MSGGATDRLWVAQALALAGLAHGTSPNPRVGCIVARGGEVVGRGYHRAAGQPHAEALAIAEAGTSARGATLYVNLEPCAHHGRTPPCSELIVSSGIRRVVASIRDPDPRVDGRGFERLRDAGVEVEVGLLGDEARRLNAAFLHWHRHAIPLVTLKAALSLDGRLSAAGGESRWITGVPARRFAHRLRLGHDAVLVGAGTLRRDDPRLTVRLPGVRADRLRVVVTGSLDLPPDARMFHGPGPRTRIYTHSAAPLPPALDGLVDIVRVPTGRAEGVDLHAVLDDLGALGVRALLVEGGARTFASFLAQGKATRAALFVSGTLLGSSGATPFLETPAVERPDLGWRFEREELLPLGRDLLLRAA